MAQQWVPKKPNFGPPPPGYVPGLGRGAIGFITRNDLGPARVQTNGQTKPIEIDDTAFAQSKYDEWEGYKGALFSKTVGDEEDRQAEQAFDFWEKRMDERREKQREQKMKKLKQKQKSKKLKTITDEYTDLKRELSKITNEQWQSIPQSTQIIKKQKKDRYIPIPDRLIVNFLSKNENTVLETDDKIRNQDYRQAKNIIFKSNLDQAENHVKGKSTVDKIGYLTALNTNSCNSEFIGDVKKARLLLKSAMQSNPKNVDVWISAARIQEIDGKIEQARIILRNAITHCAKNPDLWLELARIEKYQHSLNVLIEGLKHLPQNEALWLAAANNSNKQQKSKILRKGLQSIPQSSKLWKQLIQLQNQEQAKNLLYKAVQCLPKQVDLWIALAKLENYETAKQILNKGRKYNPLNLDIWINAAKLEEMQGGQKIYEKIQKILYKANEILKKNGNNINRQQWLQQALMCQISRNILVCKAIVNMVYGLGLTQQEILNAILKDTMLFQEERSSNQTVRFLYSAGLKALRNKQIFKKWLSFEKRKNFKQQYHEINETIRIGIKTFPEDTAFWIMMIQSYIKKKQYIQAYELIAQAKNSVPIKQRQNIALEKVKALYHENKIDQAKQELISIRDIYGGEQSTYELIKLEYLSGNHEEAWKICSGVYKSIKTAEIWALAAKIKLKMGLPSQAKMLLQSGLGVFPCSLLLWKMLIELQLDQHNIGRARAYLQKALLKVPKSQELYLTSIQLELEHGTPKQCHFILAKALKIFPKDPQFWGLAIELEPSNNRKKKASSCIQQIGENSIINYKIGKIFWRENKIDKAKKWLEQALRLDNTNGDIWGHYIKLIRDKFPQEKQLIINQFHKVQDLKGRIWQKLQNKNQSITKNNLFILELLINSIVI